MENSEFVTLNLGRARLQIPPEDVIRAVLGAAVPTISQHISTAPCQCKPPAIGQLWHGQGGIYAGVIRGEHGASYHLIVPSDSRGYTQEIKWGGQGKDERDATNEYDGYTNTVELCRSEATHPAAEWAARLEIEGHRDFYLPSRRELRLCWVNVPELFEAGWYWSSTQGSTDVAWVQGFDDGGQTCNYKDNALRARAVRRLISH